MNEQELKINPIFEHRHEGRKTKLKLTGETRSPEKGEWYVGKDYVGVACANFDFNPISLRQIVEVIYED